MPREIITGSEHDPSILVGWERDLHLQVGIEVGAVPYTGDGPHDVTSPLTIARTLWGDGDTQGRIGAYITGHDQWPVLAQRLANVQAGTFDREATTLLGRLVVEALDNYAPEHTTGIRSLWWNNPTRRQVNDLIALLRKARDQAFGKDQ